MRMVLNLTKAPTKKEGRQQAGRMSTLEARVAALEARRQRETCSLGAPPHSPSWWKR